MATDKDFMDFVMEHIEHTGDITYRKMFGEYAVYCGGKVVLLVCDNQVYVKPTEAGKALLGTVTLAPPYPGAKDHFLFDTVENEELFTRLIRITAEELPEPKPKKAKKK